MGIGIMPGPECNSLANKSKILIQMEIKALAGVPPDDGLLHHATARRIHGLTPRRDAFAAALFRGALRFASNVAFHLRSIR